VNEVLRQLIAEELERLADADERLRLLTVTAVETSDDLSRATVFVGTLPPEAAESLEERRTQLQRYVGRQVRMKRTPKLQFAPDPAVSAGERIDALLRRLASPTDPDGDPPAPAEGSG
jgi:ribosome-binding factor A